MAQKSKPSKIARNAASYSRGQERKEARRKAQDERHQHNARGKRILLGPREDTPWEIVKKNRLVRRAAERAKS